MELREIPAPSLEGNPLGDRTTRLTPIYFPPGYGHGVRQPVIYFLHGFTGAGGQWLNVSPFNPSVPQRIDRLISSGEVPPFIAVFVDGWSSLGGSQWINSDAIGRYRDYLTRDVVGWCDRELLTLARPESRAVVGKSSGGYGALVMGRCHPELFGHIASHAGDAYFEYAYLGGFPKAAGAILQAGGVESWYRDFLRRADATKMRSDDHTVIDAIAMSAAYSPNPDAPLKLDLPFELETARIRPDVWARWLAHDPVRFVPEHLDSYRQLKSLFIDCGTRDEFNLRWGARMISSALREGGVEHVHEEFEDGHMGINYRYDRSVAFLSPRLQRA
jgi:pimeloyl-ACP methyl ester carboxylesterase